MPTPGASFAGLQAKSRSAQFATDVNGVAGAGAISAQALAARRGSAYYDVAGGLGGTAQVAACERVLFARGEAKQPTIEAVEPAFIVPWSEGERHQAKARFAAHGGDVAEATREGFPSDVAGGVGVTPEVDVLDQQVGGEEQVLGSAARVKDCAIVADAEGEAGGEGVRNVRADPVDEFHLASHGLEPAGGNRLKIHDGCERRGIETGAAYEHAIDFGLPHERAGIVRLDAAAIKDAHGSGRVFAEMITNARADAAMGIGGKLRRGGLAGADGPDRLISDTIFSNSAALRAEMPCAH